MTSSRLMGSRNRTPGAELAAGLGPLRSSSGLHGIDFLKELSLITDISMQLPCYLVQ